MSVDKNSVKKCRIITINEEKIKENEKLLDKIIEDRKKARTEKKKTMLREVCRKMMSRLIDDWDLQKKEEEARTYKNLQEQKLQQWNGNEGQVRDEWDNQGQVVMLGTTVTEHVTNFEQKMLEDENVQQMAPKL